MKTQTSVFIKNMVCRRCILAVEAVFESMSITPMSVSLGEVKLPAPISEAELLELNDELKKKGFELIGDEKSVLLEKAKTLIIEVIHHKDEFDLRTNWSDFLSERLGIDYAYLSHLFSTVVGITLEQYIIRQKVEKVKEHLFYDELSVKEIAYKLGYSSVAHLSSQFKKVTGLTPTAFKATHDIQKRNPLDQI